MTAFLNWCSLLLVIVTTIGLHPLEARNLRDALNLMDLNAMPMLASYRIDPPNVPVVDLSHLDPNAREVSDL